VREFFKQAKRLDREMQVFFEFFDPPGNQFFDMAADIFDNVCYEISPDSHDESIRKKMGKTFSNKSLTDSIKYALDRGALRFDLYFMTGLPGQDRKSISDTVEFCRSIYEEIGWDRRFMPFVSPMAPFLDPGSRAFERPEKFGYRLTRMTLKEHIEAITMPSWKYILNYESDSITRDDLVDATYEAALGLNRLKGKAGGISKELMEANEERIIVAQRVMREIDAIMKENDIAIREDKLKALKEKTYKYSLSTVCEKKELEFPLFSSSFNWKEIIKTTFKKSERVRVDR
jgi:radical SAM superfamily enzyme YgiQ (UPF0313 family)